MRFRTRIPALAALLMLLPLLTAGAQEVEFTEPGDSLKVIELTDSLQVPVDSAATVQEEDGVDTLVHYAADSIDFDVIRRVTYLNGNASILYKDMRLDAGQIIVDWDAQLLTAHPLPDTVFADSARTVIDSVVMIGKPHFRQGRDDFVGDEIAYNMDSRIGRVLGGMTEYQDGYYYGEQFKRLDDDVLSVYSGEFTTCDHDPPHYHFHSQKLKILVGDRVLAKPVVLYFEDVPVMAVPYGIFPSRHGRTSGIIIPTFGESASQGRFLRDIGYYWAPSQYMDLIGSIDYFEKFGVLGRGEYRYAKRYVLNGSTKFSFDTQRQGSTRRRDYSASSSHSHIIDPNTRLNVSASYTSSERFNQDVGSVQDQLNQSVRSNATLNKSWNNSPWSLSANMGYTQNIRLDTWSASLPAITLNHKSGMLFPPPKAPRGIRGAVAPKEVRPPWYRNFTWSYSATYRNDLSRNNSFKEEGRRLGLIDLEGNQGSDQTIYGDDSLSITQKDGLTHSTSLSATARVLKYVQLNPRISAKSVWTRRVVEYEAQDKALDREDESGFFAQNTFNLSTSASTKMYGLAERPFGMGASFRHVMTPSVSFTYRPDFSDEAWGYYRTVSLPDGRSCTYDRFRDVAATPKGLSERFTFRLDHLFQMKTGDPEENTERKYDLLSVGMNTGVDMKKDSLKWDNLRTSLRTSIPGTLFGPVTGLSLETTTTHSLYQQSGGTRINRYYWERDNAVWYAPLELTNASFNIGFAVRAQTLGSLFGIGRVRKPPGEADSLAAVSDSVEIPLNPADIEDPARSYTPPPPMTTGRQQGPSQLHQMPLNIRVSMRTSRDFISDTKTSSLSTSSTFSLTPRYEISFDYNYDLERREVRNVGVSVTRDLHCWDASFTWSPTGYRQGYFLRIGLKSPQLRDVKIERQRGSGFGRYG